MEDPLSLVRIGYDRWAAVYDHDANPMPLLEGPAVRSLIGDPCGLSAVDLGCGTGRHALWLAKFGANVTALDFSEGMLAEAARKPGAERIRFLAHDLHEPLPLPKSTFELAVSGLVLEHIRDLTPFFCEVRRVLKLRGRAVVSAMHPAMFLRGSQARFTDPTSGELVQPGSIAHPMGTLVMSAVRAGLKLEAIEELTADEALAAKAPRAAKYVGWPMLVVMSLVADGSGSFPSR